MKQLNLFEAKSVPNRKFTRKRIEREGRKDAPWVVADIKPRTPSDERRFGGRDYFGPYSVGCSANYMRGSWDSPTSTPHGKKKRKKRKNGWLRRSFTDEQIARITKRWIKSK